MIYTDALQTLIMVVGAVILTIKGEGCPGSKPCAIRLLPCRTQASLLGMWWVPWSSHEGDRGCLLSSCSQGPAACWSLALGQPAYGTELPQEHRAQLQA